MPYTKTTWTSGTTPVDAPEMNNLETQYLEAINSFEPDLYTAFVYNGLTATKDGTVLSQLDVTSGIAFLLQTDGSLRKRAPTSSTQSATGHPSTTLYLDLNPDGSWSWGTTHSGVSNYLSIASVTTDASSNILVVTDLRTTNTTMLPSYIASGRLTLPALKGVNAYPLTPASADDSLYLHDRNSVLGVTIGWGQGGSGLFAYDQVNLGYVFNAATKNAITFGGAIYANNGPIQTGQYFTAVMPGSGNAWLTAVDFPLSGSPTANTNWRLVYNGQTGAMMFWDVTRNRLVLSLDPGGYAWGQFGVLGQLRSNGGGASGGNIWVGTVDPGALALEGDIWIDA